MAGDNPIIIIPYRNRQHHLAKFLAHYRRILPEAFFLVVEQSHEKQFNRGKLLNVGFLEMMDKANHFIFHDVDMLSQGRPDYSFTETPTLFATHASQFHWQLPFPEYFGGVIGFSKRHYLRCNGHPNSFWGWGGEDNAMYFTAIAMGLTIAHRPHRYYSQPHPKSHATGLDVARLHRARQPRAREDGLRGCDYTIINTTPFPYGKIIEVSI